MAGLKIFLREASTPPTASSADMALGQIGNCLACYAAPNFTDFKLHNTGVAQREYDDPAVGTGHVLGPFAALSIPNLATRTVNDLPATEQHPSTSDRFRSIPTAGTTLTDLGVWIVFANPDMPNLQAKIRAILRDEHLPLACPTDSVLLDEAIARFKTPGIRDLDHSTPYMHNSKFDTLDNAVGFYLGSSSSARAGTLRNGANALKGIALLPADISPLVAFLKSLNEDFQQGRSTKAGATSRCTIHRQRNGRPPTPRAGAFSSSRSSPPYFPKINADGTNLGYTVGTPYDSFLICSAR